MIHHNTLEFNVCRHCMNRCACCSHASPFAKPYFMEPDQIRKDLDSLKRFMQVNEVYALGGEPLLHPKICDILDVFKSSGIARKVCMLTNGQLFWRMPEDFWKKIEVLRVSAYPNLDKEMLNLAASKSKQYGFHFGIDYVDLFWKQFKRVPDDGKNFHECPWKGACWTVHDGYFYLCPNAAFFPDSFMGMETSPDGLSLHEGLTEERLKAFIERKEPFKTCSICDSFRQRNPWHEVQTREEWIKDATL